MSPLLSRDVLEFVALVSTGALLVITHLAVARRLFEDPTMGRPMRWLALVPPFTPIVAFVEGKRAGAYLWITAFGIYVAVRWATA